MATTGRPISELSVGIRDTTGAVVASGKARFYQPGGLVSRDVYSDDVCTSAITQPLTLNAGGQYPNVFTLEPTRMIVKDSTETTTYYDGIVNLNRHDAVYVTSTNINGGAETTLETVLATAATSLGSGDFQYKESSGATARAMTEVIGERWISGSDFGAVGDLSNDDTAELQAAIDRAAARSVSEVFIPEGSYKISAPLTVSTAGMTIRGVGHGHTTITNYGTTTNAFTISAAQCTIADIFIGVATSSSASAVAITSGDYAKIERVSISGHATGVTCTAVNGTIICDSQIIGSTQAMNLGPRSKVSRCEIVQGADTGTGVLVTGADCRVSDVYVSDTATGIWVVGNRATISDCTLAGVGTNAIYIDTGSFCVVKGCHVTGTTTTGINNTSGAVEAVISECIVAGCTTGIVVAGARSTALGCIVGTSTTGFSLTAANASLRNCITTGGTTGISTGTAASMSITGCFSSATTALSAGAATLFHENGNTWTGTYTNGASSTRDQRLRFETEMTTSSTTPVTFTPDITTGQIQWFHGSHAAAGQAVTVAAHATATLAVGDFMRLCFAKTGANNITLTWNAQYIDADGSAMTAVTITSANVRTFDFHWNGTAWRCSLITTDVGI